MAIRVLLVDDVADLRLMFRAILEADEAFEVVGEAGDGLEALEMAGTLKPDLVILDLAMPRLDGLSAIPKLHRATPGVRILVLSGFESDDVAGHAISACASDFLRKGASPQEITETAHKVHRSPAKSCAAA